MHNQKQTTKNCISLGVPQNIKCPAILKAKNETVIDIEAKSTHNQECDPCKCKASKIVNQVKRRAQYSSPTVAIANEISEISD